MFFCLFVYVCTFHQGKFHISVLIVAIKPFVIQTVGTAGWQQLSAPVKVTTCCLDECQEVYRSCGTLPVTYETPFASYLQHLSHSVSVGETHFRVATNDYIQNPFMSYKMSKTVQIPRT